MQSCIFQSFPRGPPHQYHFFMMLESGNSLVASMISLPRIHFPVMSPHRSVATRPLEARTGRLCTRASCSATSHLAMPGQCDTPWAVAANFDRKTVLLLSLAGHAFKCWRLSYWPDSIGHCTTAISTICLLLTQAACGLLRMLFAGPGGIYAVGRSRADDWETLKRTQ